jgi:thiosulfate dehydrogenase
VLSGGIGNPRGATVMFRGFVLGVLGTIVAAVAGGFVVLRSGLIPANADANPGWLETWSAETSLDATLRREAKSPNPAAMTDDNLVAGIKLYAERGAICHGTAKGDESTSLPRRAFTRGLRNWRQTV